MATQVDFQLNWEPTGFQAPFFLGAQRGYYADEGLDVRMLGARGGGVGTGSPFATERVADRSCEFAWAGGSGTVLSKSRGNDIVVVAGATHRTPAAVFTLEDEFGGPLEDPEQLADTTIAPTATKTSLLAQMLLREAGVRDDVQVLGVDQHTHHRPQRKLLDGTIDAAVGVVTNGEELAREYDRTPQELSIGLELPIYGMGIVTNPEYAAENPETVEAFLRASARSWADAVADPGAAIDAVVERNADLEYTREIERRKLDWMLDEFVDYSAFSDRWGEHDAERWAELVERMSEMNALAEAVDPESLWTEEYLDDSPAITGFLDRAGKRTAVEQADD
ncbi:ABC transporter substrate-binding protein [Halolamina salifodinae]|uniref:Thiamine pyrimidine synthase n=1 Tax=Halolamina salifodinae TaxID=1202767 RepID=A0A8T4GWV4_9EURY|nr:ABC transporter substrate-binding protein [Halolamina salifodinae]MBP1987406.1 NitT/TauT family transport system substrate-binding protein [Halolamina salifodinae]